MTSGVRGPAEPVGMPHLRCPLVVTIGGELHRGAARTLRSHSRAQELADGHSARLDVRR